MVTDQQVLNKHQAAEILGMAPVTLVKLIRQGKIGGYIGGARWRIPLFAIREFQEEQIKRTRDAAANRVGVFARHPWGARRGAGV